MKFLFLVMLILNLNAPLSYGHYKDIPSTLKLTFVKGENWKKKNSYNKQSKVGDHINFIKKMYKDGYIYLAYANSESSLQTLLLQNLSKTKLKSKLESHQMIRSKILNYKIDEIIVTMRSYKDHQH